MALENLALIRLRNPHTDFETLQAEIKRRKWDWKRNKMNESYWMNAPRFIASICHEHGWGYVEYIIYNDWNVQVAELSEEQQKEWSKTLK